MRFAAQMPSDHGRQSVSRYSGRKVGWRSFLQPDGIESRCPSHPTPWDSGGVVHRFAPNLADRLPVTRAAIEEAARLYPPIAAISRVAVEADKFAGTVIPRGTLVVIAPYVLHRHRMLWPDPDVFDPRIQVEMSEMEYTPSRIEVKRGEQIRFVIRNVGKEDHEFLLATTEENLKHAEEMKKNPHMEHDDPNGVRLKPKKSAEIIWKFTKPGTFEYSCLIPDHRDYGMIGKVTVK